VGQPSVVFAPSTIYLDFPRSDGDETKWPSNTIYDIDSDGQVNFMEHLDIDQSGQVKKWRAAIGKAIATKLEMQGDRESVCFVPPSSIDSPSSSKQLRPTKLAGKLSYV
jgi:hypothetical protein